MKKFIFKLLILLDNENVIKREFGAFDGINDDVPKFVLFLNKEDFSRDGVIHENIIEWF